MIKDSNFTSTTDKLIRASLIDELYTSHKNDPNLRIIEELGITHGAARVDIAVVNGMIHGYELKSDLDTLYRLPEQIRIYNSVLDQITLVVGKNHLLDAIKMVPEWWGVVMAKIIDSQNTITFSTIRESDKNPKQDSVSIARLLWREEALEILEKIGKADGVRSKPRSFIYERLALSLNQMDLRKEVRKCLYTRTNWRSEK